MIVITGPSASGKTATCLYLQSHFGIRKVVTHTTRTMRVGEKNGVDYHFVDKEEFLRMKANGEFVETVFYNDNYYGTLRSEVERHMREKTPVILVIEVEGAGNIKRLYPGATTVFVLPPNMEELERRLRCRGTEDEATIQKRLKRAQTEIANSVDYDEHVVNVEVDSCAESLYSIIQFHITHGKE